MPPNRDTHSTRRTTVLTAVVACLATGLVGNVRPLPASAAPVFDPSGLENQLVGQLQQDRSQQGLNGFVVNATLNAFARGAPYQPCPGVIANGRAQDMVERNYFSHQVPPCGAEAWPSIQSAGLALQGWGENIAWSQGSGAATAGVVNAGFMASPDHRANILGPYNLVGVGAWPAAGSWTGGGGARTGVIVFAVIFARVPSVPGLPVPRAVPPPPVAVAPPSSRPPPPPPSPPPPPPSQAPDARSGTRTEFHVPQHPLPVQTLDESRRGPVVLGWLGVLLALGLGGAAALRLARLRRRGASRP